MKMSGWVGKSTHIQSKKLSLKEAQLDLAGKEICCSYLLSRHLDYKPRNIGYTSLCIRLFVLSQLFRIYGHKFF